MINWEITTELTAMSWITSGHQFIWQEQSQNYLGNRRAKFTSVLNTINLTGRCITVLTFLFLPKCWKSSFSSDSQWPSLQISTSDQVTSVMSPREGLQRRQNTTLLPLTKNRCFSLKKIINKYPIPNGKPAFYSLLFLLNRQGTPSKN